MLSLIFFLYLCCIIKYFRALKGWGIGDYATNRFRGNLDEQVWCTELKFHTSLHKHAINLQSFTVISYERPLANLVAKTMYLFTVLASASYITVNLFSRGPNWNQFSIFVRLGFDNINMGLCKAMEKIDLRAISKCSKRLFHVVASAQRSSQCTTF